MYRILFMVEFGNVHLFTYAIDREDAKREARSWIGGNSDEYIITPLTEKGDRIRFNITLFA